MKLLTVEETIEALKKEGTFVTKNQFNFYSKSGLLFNPDIKTKKRLREPIQLRYGEGNLEKLKRIASLKAEGWSLKEIHHELFTEDTKIIQTLFDKAGLSTERTFVKQAEGRVVVRRYPDFGLMVSTWRKEGYYRGLLSIYNTILAAAANTHDVITLTERTYQYIQTSAEPSDKDSQVPGTHGHETKHWNDIMELKINLEKGIKDIIEESEKLTHFLRIEGAFE